METLQFHLLLQLIIFGLFNGNGIIIICYLGWLLKEIVLDERFLPALFLYYKNYMGPKEYQESQESTQEKTGSVEKPASKKKKMLMKKPHNRKKGSEVEWINQILRAFTRQILKPSVSAKTIQELLDSQIDLLVNPSQAVKVVLEAIEVREANVAEFPLQFSSIKFQHASHKKLQLDISVYHPGDTFISIGIRNWEKLGIEGRDFKFETSFSLFYGPLNRDLNLAPIGIEVVNDLVIEAGGVLYPPIKIVEVLVELLLSKINSVKIYDPMSGYPHIPTPALPKGLIRIYLMEGHQIPMSNKRKLSASFKKKKQHSFVILSVDRYKVCSPVVIGPDPTWNYYCEFGIQEPGLLKKVLTLSVMDEEDMIGVCHVSLSQVDTVKGVVSDMWCSTWNENYTTGKIRIRVQWAPLLIPQPFPSICPMKNNPARPFSERYSGGILVLHIEKVKTKEKIRPVVSVQRFGKETFTTARGHLSTKWEFEEEITVLIEDPFNEWLLIQLHDLRDKKFTTKKLLLQKDKDVSAALAHKNKDWENISHPVVGKVEMPVIHFFKGPLMMGDSEEFTRFDGGMEASLHFASSIKFEACVKLVAQPSFEITK